MLFSGSDTVPGRLDLIIEDSTNHNINLMNTTFAIKRVLQKKAASTRHQFQLTAKPSSLQAATMLNGVIRAPSTVISGAPIRRYAHGGPFPSRLRDSGIPLILHLSKRQQAPF